MLGLYLPQKTDVSGNQKLILSFNSNFIQLTYKTSQEQGKIILP